MPKHSRLIPTSLPEKLFTNAWIICTNVYLSIKWTSVNLFLSRWTSWIVCEMDFSRCGFLIALRASTEEKKPATENGRKIDLSGRLTLIFRMLWQKIFFLKTVEKNTTLLCWSNKSLIGEMAWSEIHSLFKFKCHVSVNFREFLQWFAATRSTSNILHPRQQSNLKWLNYNRRDFKFIFNEGIIFGKSQL